MRTKTAGMALFRMPVPPPARWARGVSAFLRKRLFHDLLLHHFLPQLTGTAPAGLRPHGGPGPQPHRHGWQPGPGQGLRRYPRPPGCRGPHLLVPPGAAGPPLRLAGRAARPDRDAGGCRPLAGPGWREAPLRLFRRGLGHSRHLQHGRRPEALRRGGAQGAAGAAAALRAPLHRRGVQQPRQLRRPGRDHRAGAGRRAGRRLRDGAVLQPDRGGAGHQVRPAGGAVQPVPRHGRLQPDCPPHRRGAGRAHDPERPHLHRRGTA